MSNDDGVNSDADILSNNLKQFFEPLIYNLDESVSSLRLSQVQLGSQIDDLANQLKVINESLQKQPELDDYSKRLIQAKKRVNSVHATVLSVEERLNKLYNSIKKDQIVH